MSREVVGLIPVKGDSERVQKKNLRPFGNTNLFELKLQQLKLAKGFSEIIVSSEDQHILKIAEQHGYTIHNRDPYYSTNDVPMSEVYSHIASELPGEHVAWLNVTNPLAEGPIYSQAIEKYKSMAPHYDCLLSVWSTRLLLFQWSADQFQAISLASVTGFRGGLYNEFYDQHTATTGID